MTNQIDQLWGKALDQALPDTYTNLTWTQVEKIKQVFAELIVRECADMVDRAISDGGVDGRVLKEHFGVE
jgi:hypothetical protein